MVVVDQVDKSNEKVEVKGNLPKIEKEMKILNSDDAAEVDDVTQAMKALAVDQVEDLSNNFICLGLEKESEEPGENSDEEGGIVHGDHREDEVKLVSRGPPGIATMSEVYEMQNESMVNQLVTNITRGRTGGKRSHNEPVDAMSKGFKPQDQTPDVSTKVSQNQLSGGSVRCSKPGKPTVRELIALEEQKKQQQMYLLQQQLQQQQQQSQFVNEQQSLHGQQYSFAQQTVPQQQTKMNIPAEPPLFEGSDDEANERIPSFDPDAILKTLMESEEMTEQFQHQQQQQQLLQQQQQQLLQQQQQQQQQLQQQEQQLQAAFPAQQTQLPSAGIRRVRNQPSMSDSSVSGPRTPESGYQTATPPGSPRSDTSRPNSFDEEKLDPQTEEALTLFEEWLKDKEVEHQSRPSCQFAKIGQPTMPPQDTHMTLASQAPAAAPPQQQQQQQRPMQYPVTCTNSQVVSQPVFIVQTPNVTCIPAAAPRPSCPPPVAGKGRPPNSAKGHLQAPTRQRPILPKPAPVQIIPTTVTGPPPCAQQQCPPINVTSTAPNPATQSVQPQLACQVLRQQQAPNKNEPTKYAPIAPKTVQQQRGDSLMKRSMPDILTDTKLKIRAHRQIVGKSLEEILKPDADGDTWLHSYIVYLNENNDVVYMINAIISRLKREHKESNINIKQVINTQNNSYQTPVYLATVMNNQYVLDWLLKAGGDPNIVASSQAPSGTVRKGPLHYAASRGDECLDVLYVLLECRDTDLNLKNTDGLSPLHVAVQSHGKPIPNSSQFINSTRVIEALIQKGANLEEVDDKNGKTPIHNLVESQCYELISAIFNVIPEPDLKKYLRKQTFQGNTALHIAAQCPMASIDDHKKVIKLLLEKGADTSMKNAENQTASQLAYRPHREELSPLLKASHGKSIHNAQSPSAYNAWSPGSQPAIKPAGSMPPSPAGNTNAAQQTYIVVQALPTAPAQLIAQPLNTQVPVVTIPQNTMLGTQPLCTIPSGNQTLTYTQVPQQVVRQQNCYTSPMNSPQTLPMGSPQAAQSPPQVNSPEMSQANHDFTSGSQLGPTSPPQQTNMNQMYQQFGGVVH